MIEKQLVLVLDVCKTTHAYIENQYTCRVNTSNLRATLTTVNFLALKHACNENRKLVIICYYSLYQSFLNFRCHCTVFLLLGFTGMQERLLTHSPLSQWHPFSPNTKEVLNGFNSGSNAFPASALAPIFIHYK